MDPNITNQNPAAPVDPMAQPAPAMDTPVVDPMAQPASTTIPEPVAPVGTPAPVAEVPPAAPVDQPVVGDVNGVQPPMGTQTV